MYGGEVVKKGVGDMTAASVACVACPRRAAAWRRSLGLEYEGGVDGEEDDVAGGGDEDDERHAAAHRLGKPRHLGVVQQAAQVAAGKRESQRAMSAINIITIT